MKKFLISVILVLIATAAGLSQATVKSGAKTILDPAQKEAFDKIQKLNAQAIDLYRQRKYNDALPIALEVKDIIEKKGLAENSDSLVALANLAEIYLAKNKELTAIELFSENTSYFSENAGRRACLYRQDHRKAGVFSL